MTLSASHVAFFAFISELREPRDFPKALALLQICDVTMYIVAALVIYRYAGKDVKSPALGSAGPIVTKVAYGIAIPTVRTLRQPALPPSWPSYSNSVHRLSLQVSYMAM
jgi:hypothetical protein